MLMIFAVQENVVERLRKMLKDQTVRYYRYYYLIRKFIDSSSSTNQFANKPN